MNHDSPASIQNLLRDLDIAPRKRWGQNFMINRGARKKLLNLLQVEDGMKVWEIGPGLGAITMMLLERTSAVTVFEIDPAFCRYLEGVFGSQGIGIVQGDVMCTWKNQWQSSHPIRVFGNLPYNLASRLMISFIENRCIAERCVFTVQDEVGQRMMAKPGSKNYSSFSVLCQTFCRIIDGGRLAPGSFYPAPRVHSRIMVLENAPVDVKSPEIFQTVLNSLFCYRRKTLSNNLKAAVDAKQISNLGKLEQALTDNGISLQQRPQSLSPEEWIAIANTVVSSP